jgi:hypothetical protein
MALEVTYTDLVDRAETYQQQQEESCGRNAKSKTHTGEGADAAGLVTEVVSLQGQALASRQRGDYEEALALFQQVPLARVV